MSGTAVPFPHEPERIRAWTLAVRHLRRGEAGREAALEVLIDAGFSAREAALIIAAILDDQERPS